MKKLTILLVFLLSVASVSALVGHVYPYSLEAGVTSELVVTFFNHGSSDVDELQVKGYIPDLDVRTTSAVVDVGDGESARAYLLVDVPAAVTPDYYPVLISSQNEDGVREKTHSWVYISG